MPLILPVDLTTTGQEIVDRVGYKLEGQLSLFPDPEFIIQNSKFKSSGDLDFDRRQIAYYWMHYSPDSNIKGESKKLTAVYHSWSDACYQNFTFIRCTGAHWLETNQIVVSISAYQDQPAADHLHELYYWLPYIKPVVCEVGKAQDCKEKDKLWGEEASAIQIKIFEHTLSASGAWRMRIYEQKENRPSIYQIAFYRSRYVYSIKWADSLEQLIESIKEQCYYQKQLKESFLEGSDEYEDEDESN
jgi:hypothetical protein